MKEKIIETLKSWFIEIAEIGETKNTIYVKLNKYICLTSAEIKMIEEDTGKIFFVEFRKEHLILTWVK